MSTTRVVVLGGAGNFGARIVRALCDDPAMEVVSAGRRATPVPGADQVTVVALDMHAPDFAGRLLALRPGLVVHCVGPFQQQDYRVATASLAAGAHYLDLADGREFVAQFADRLRHDAQRAGRVALSGASTLPALSSAVIERLRLPLRSLERIEIAIAPGQRAPRGAATLAAVFSYLGRPVRVWRAQRWQTSWGWMGLRNVRLAFGTRWGAICDVPDLELLPRLFPGVATVAFHAALEFRLQHIVLWALAGLRRMGLPLAVERWSSQLDRCAGLFDRFGGACGGMCVSVVGESQDGRRLRRTWQLTAPALHGPEIPCMAAILLARRLVREPLPANAAACTGYLALDDFEPEFARWQIETRIEEDAA